MSFDTIAASTYGAMPFELFWFTMAPAFGDLDAQEWRFTSDLEDRTYNGDTYSTMQISKESVKQNQELSSGELTITVPSDSEIANLFRADAPLAPVSLTVFEGHDGDDGVLMMFSGQIESIEFQGAQAKLYAKPDYKAVTNSIPCVLYQEPCSRVLYSEECSVPLAGFSDALAMRWTGVVASIDSSDDRIITLTDTCEFVQHWASIYATMSAAGTWDVSSDMPEPSASWGFIILSNGRGIMIEKQKTGAILQLMTGSSDLAAGDTITVQRGCARTLKSCKQIFGTSRKLCYFGCPDVPGANPFAEGLY